MRLNSSSSQGHVRHLRPSPLWLVVAVVATMLIAGRTGAQAPDVSARIGAAQRLAETAPGDAEPALAAIGDPALLPSDLLRGRYFHARGLARANLQRPTEALEDFQAAARLATAAGDGTTAARAKLGMASMTEMLRGFDASQPLFEAAVLHARAIGDAETEALIHAVRARVATLNERVDLALQSVRAAQAIAAVTRLSAATRATIAGSAAWVYRRAGDADTAARFLEEARGAAREDGDRMTEADLIIAAADLAHEIGNHDEALRLARQARVSYEAQRDHIAVAVADLRASACLLALGQRAEALALARAASDRLATGGNPVLALEARLALARAEIETGDFATALRTLAEAGKTIDADTPAATQAAYQRLLARANAGTDRYPAAFMALQESDRWQAQDTARKLEMRTAAQRALLDYERLEREKLALEQQAQSSAARLASSNERTAMLAALLAALAVMTAALVYGFVRQRRLTRQIASLADTDHLTGISNRRGIDETGAAMMAARRRGDLPLSVIELDIDEFKSINDRYGHAAGDAALQAVAKVLRAQLRDADRIGRYGGEEFLVILPSLGAGEAAAVAERLRTAVQALDVRAGERALPITVSAGVAGTHPSDRSFEEVVRRADGALYDAKARGRNLVVVAPPPALASAA